MKKYLITYKVRVCVDAENKKDALAMAMTHNNYNFDEEIISIKVHDCKQKYKRTLK